MWDTALMAMLDVQEWHWVHALRTSTWIYPFLNAAHIIGFALLFGAITIVDLGILRRGDYDPKHDGPIVRMALAGFAIALATGLVLFAVRANAYIQNPFMAAKLGLMALAGLNALALHRLIFRQRDVRSASASAAAAKTSAVCSLTFWVGTICSGRLVGFW